MDVQPVHEVRSVYFDRVDAQPNFWAISLVESPSAMSWSISLCLEVSTSKGFAPGFFTFPPLQAAHIVRDDRVRYGRAQKGLSLLGGSYGKFEFPGRRLFEDVPGGPDLERLEHVFFVGVHGEENDTKAREIFLGLGSYFKAVEARKTDVEQDYVGVGFPDAREGFVPFSGLAHDPDVFRFFEKGLDTRSYELVVVNEQDAYRFHSSHPSEENVP